MERGGIWVLYLKVKLKEIAAQFHTGDLRKCEGSISGWIIRKVLCHQASAPHGENQCSEPRPTSFWPSFSQLVAQSCPTLCHPMDCSPLGSSVHGILQAKILEWVPISFSRGSSQPRDQTRVSCVNRRILHHCTTWEALSPHCSSAFAQAPAELDPWVP